MVLVHGAWHGAWCWERVLPLLHDRGVWATAMDLPGHGASPLPPGDLHGDADAVVSALDRVDAPVVLVGHSYGGAVITDAGAHPAVAHLMYIAAFVPDAHESVAMLTKSHDEQPLLDRAVERRDDGTSAVIPHLAAAALYHDCPDPGQAVARLGLQPVVALTQRPRRAAWRSVSSTYLVCGQDRAVPPGLQRRMAGRTEQTRECDSGHAPFLSQPQLVADLVHEVVLSTRMRR